jgi:hypothetical protein
MNAVLDELIAGLGGDARARKGADALLQRVAERLRDSERYQQMLHEATASGVEVGCVEGARMARAMARMHGRNTHG